MSADLVWQIVKNNNAYLVKKCGVQFSSEPGNLMNVNSFKYSGIANNKAVIIGSTEKGVSFATTKASNKNLKTTAVELKKGARPSANAAKNVLKGYRPDLSKAAAARVSAILKSKKPAKTIKKREQKGARKVRA
jgi:large subunit ribosomal protein L28e